MAGPVDPAIGDRSNRRRKRNTAIDDILLIEASFERVRSRIEGLAIRPVVMDDAGELVAAGGPLTPDAVHPAGVWLDVDVWRSPASQRFLRLALEAPELRWAQTATAGIDAPIFRQFLDKGVTLTTSHGQAVGIADYVLWGVLDHFQRGPERRREQAEREWRVLPFREIETSRWLIVGFGAIGQAVAQRARAFGAHIVGVRRSGDSHPLADQVVEPEDLASALPEADVIVLCAPLDDATRGLVDRDLLARFKPGSVLVNVGRGALVDEAALLKSLDLGCPAHAILDVFAVEPLPAASPIWAHPAVHVTAHTAWASSRLAARNDAQFVENLRRFSTGEPLLNQVATRA